MSDLNEMLILIKSHREMAVIASLPLNDNSKVMVAGAYTGDTVDFISKLYDCEVHGYEPQDWAFERCDERFYDDPNVFLHRYGLGTERVNLPMFKYGTDACSFVIPETASAQARESGYLAEVTQEIRLQFPGGVNLAVFNMEGYEYQLLPHMAETDSLDLIKHLIIQFHGTVDSQEHKRALRSLARTHIKTWGCGNWQLWQNAFVELVA